MFFLHNIERVIPLHPSFLGPNMRKYLLRKLLDDVEGTCNGRFYIITVLDELDISPGRVLPGLATAEFTILYRAVVYKPFRGEVVDAKVTSVNHQGFQSEVGPMTLFVSAHLIPDAIRFDADSTPAKYTNGSDQIIEKDAWVRIKLMGIRSDVNKIFGIGTIKEDFLGPLGVFSRLSVTLVHKLPLLTIVDKPDALL